MKTYEYVNFGLFGNAANILGKVGGFFGNVGQGIGTGVGNAANATGNFFKNMGQGIATGVGNTVNAVKTGVGNAVNAVKEDWNSMGSQLQSGYNDVRNGGAAQQQPAVASDGTVVKNENTPNFEDINPNTYDATQNTTTIPHLYQTRDDGTLGGMHEGSLPGLDTGAGNPAVANAKLDKAVAQTEADQAVAAKKAQADAAAKKKAEQEAAAQQQAQAKQQASQAGQALSGMKAILAAINAGRPLNPSQQNVLRQNNVKADPNAIQQWIQQHGG